VSGRVGAVFAAGAVHLPRSFTRWILPFRGEVRRGLGNLEPGPCFPGGGGGSGFPSAFQDWSSLLSVYSWSRAVVFPTSPSLLFEGVRSGTRRRRGPGTSAQATRRLGQERGAQCPYARALRCAACVPQLFVGSATVSTFALTYIMAFLAGEGADLAQGESRPQ
jgi:hypothetical protein